MNKNKYSKIDAFIIIACILFLIWRAPYGFCYNDESFVVTLAERVWNGDKLIFNEWHGTMNFGAVLLPFYSLFRLFSKNNDGIILFLRYVYCIAWSAVCIDVYIKLKRKYKYAIFVFAYLALFSPLDIMNLSYVSVGLMCRIYMTLTLWYQYEYREYSPAGFSARITICFLIFTLCCPLISIVYVFSVIFSFFIYIKKKDKYAKSYLISVLPLAAFTVLYLWIFVLKGQADGSLIKRLSECLSVILADPEHQSLSNINFTGFVKYILSLLYLVFDSCRIYYFIIASVIAASVLLFQNKYKYSKVLFLTALFGFAYSQFMLIVNINDFEFNQQMLNITALGITAFILTKNRDCGLMIFYVSGIVYTVINNISSNTGIMSVSQTISVCGIAAIISLTDFAGDCMDNTDRKYHIQKEAVIMLVMLLQFMPELYIRSNRQYWDAHVKSLDYEIEYGAAKGLLTTEDNKDRYESGYFILRDAVEKTDSDSILVLGRGPYYYLDSGCEYCTPSAWWLQFEDMTEIINQYQTVNPDKIPDIIFCAEKTYIPSGFESDGYEVIYDGEYVIYAITE